MKSNLRSPWVNCARISLISLSFNAAIHAADFTWDNDPATPGIQSGSGTWDAATANWITGGANTPYVEASQVTKTYTAFGATVNTITVADTTGLAIGQEISLTQFAIGTTITGISGTTLTLSNSSTTAGGAGSAVFQVPSNTIFGSSASDSGTITLAGAHAAKNITLNGNYTFTGGTLTFGSVRDGVMTVNNSSTFNNVVNIANSGANRINFATAGQTLAFNGGGNILSTGNTSGIGGSTPAIQASSTVLVGGGVVYGTNGTSNWNIGDAAAGTGGVRISGTGTVVNVGPFQVGNTNGAYTTVTSGAVLSSNSQVSIGRNGTTYTGKVSVDGGTFRANSTDTTQTITAVGRANGIGVLEVKNGGRLEVQGSSFTNNGGGVLVLNSQATTAAASGTLDISGGVAVIKDLRFNGVNRHVLDATAASTNGKSILNLSGGALYIGGTVVDSVGGVATDVQGGISNKGTGASTYQVNLNGGTLGASASWVSSVVMTLGAATNTILKAANEANAAQNITFTNQLTGSGGWTKTGDGTLTLNSTTALNNFTGGSTINAGTVVAAAQNSFGTGSVTLANLAILTLQNNATIADTAALMFGTTSVINLDFTGAADVLTSLTNTTTGVSAAPGTYTAPQLNSIFGGISAFNGTGSLTIIPEPGSSALLGIAAASLAFTRRRKPNLPA